MTHTILEEKKPVKTEVRRPKAARPIKDGRSKAIAQRLAKFRETMDLIETIPDNRGAAGMGALPENIRDLAYDEREAVLL